MKVLIVVIGILAILATVIIAAILTNKYYDNQNKKYKR